MSSNVLVIGGGIAGIQAALNLADSGIHVYLVEKKPTIGGHMALLDKTFPTNDCSICILAPKLAECSNHPLIDILAYSEVLSVKGQEGDFKVEVQKKARYIDMEKCTGCEDCTRSCPVRVPNEFNLGLNMRKAIYIPFPQSVPRVATIDAEKCLHFVKGKCGVCKMKCGREAVDFDQKDEVVELDVGSIIVASGFDVFDPRVLTEYKYGVHKDVVTSMEFERILCASGPTAGKITRPSDGKTPDRIVFIQCVGSRDPQHGRPYCSSVCCMHATKEAMLIKEHDEHIETYIMYTDLRTAGKGFFEYAERGKRDYGISYIRAKPGRITRDDESGDLEVWYEDTATKGVKKLNAGMVVLATNLMPSKGAAKLAEILNVELDEYGFFRSPDPLLRPVDTTRPGIFTTGYCESPKDIPESVAQAGAAALRASRIIAGVTA